MDNQAQYKLVYVKKVVKSFNFSNSMNELYFCIKQKHKL